jgi:thiol-disulfide isomerase/thioredoxin
MMVNRVALPMALGVAVALVVALVAVLALARPRDSVLPSGMASPAEPSGMERPPKLLPRRSGPLAPDFAGGGAWINSEPLALADLRGKVVLVNFWTYGCYNCQNTLPYVKQWWAKYKDQGLVIVGVHTPEFQYEAELENVAEAVKREKIGWPVVQDNEKQIWRAYGNHYWPRFYLVDDRGQIIYDHIGEGAYEETERQIAAALAAAQGNYSVPK